MEMARQHQVAEHGEENAAAAEPIKSVFPSQLRRRYEIFLQLPDGEKLMPMRSITSQHLGSLVKLKVRASNLARMGLALADNAAAHAETTVYERSHETNTTCMQGVVTNCTDVKPQVSVATYLDITSGIEMFQEVVGPVFTPVDKGHKEVNPMGEPMLQMRGSKLIKFQQVKIQEMADEVPSSATPRCVHLQAINCS